jgi:hypothetical protein
MVFGLVAETAFVDLAYDARTTGSIFEKTKVPLAKWLHVVVLWTIETSVTNTCALTSLSMHTVIDLFQFLRDICGGKLLQNPVQLAQLIVFTVSIRLRPIMSNYLTNIYQTRLLTIRKYPVAGVVLVSTIPKTH